MAFYSFHRFLITCSAILFIVFAVKTYLATSETVEGVSWSVVVASGGVSLAQIGYLIYYRSFVQKQKKIVEPNS